MAIFGTGDVFGVVRKTDIDPSYEEATLSTGEEAKNEADALIEEFDSVRAAGESVTEDEEEGPSDTDRAIGGGGKRPAVNDVPAVEMTVGAE